MLPEDKRIHTKQDLNEWLQYERGKYGEDNLKGKIREFFPISERDILKNSILEKCGIPLLRIRTDESGVGARITSELRRVIG